MSVIIEPISEGITLVRGKNNGRFPFSHSVLVEKEEGEYVLIDTGCGIDILKELKGRYPITTLINSHTHPDHSAGDWVFSSDSRRLFVPEEGIDTSGSVVKLSERLAEPGDLATYWQGFVKEAMGFNDYTATDTYNGDTRFTFDGITLLPIHTPGHTKDHYCLYEPTKKILFAFDYDLTGFGPWYGHRESDIGEFILSIDKLEALDIDVFVSGHKGIITDRIKERLGKYRSIFAKNEEKILALLETGVKTIGGLADASPIYGGFPYAEPLLRYWEGQMIEKHLLQLIEKGGVTKGKNGVYALL